MARIQPKQRFLPSLLDRLTDDDPINHSMKQQQRNIKRVEKDLSQLLAKRENTEVAEDLKEQHNLQQKLDQLRAQLGVFSASISSLTEVRACVKRDLNWLLNANQYSPQSDFKDYPDIQNSVLNYGMPDLTGKTVSGVDMGTLERMLKEVIIHFEPRIIQHTLSIRVLVDKSLFDHNAVTFEIEGQLWAEPQPLHLHLRTEFELESGDVAVYDFEQVGH